jgi:hypothetical protein
MFTYTGGNRAGAGTYWDVSTGHRIDIAGEGVLPGENRTRYVKASSIVMLLFGPIIGLAYVVFLPIMGIATVTAMILQKVFGGMLNVGRNIVSFGWRPSEAYLAGKNRKKGNGKKTPDRSDTN